MHITKDSLKHMVSTCDMQALIAFHQEVYQFNTCIKLSVEIVLLIVLKCYVVLGHSEVGEKLQRVACHGEAVDRNFVVERL